MARFTVPKDLDDVEEFPIVKPGVYNASIRKAEIRQSQDGTSDNLWLHWTIEDGDPEEIGKPAVQIISLKEQALFRLKQVMVALDMEASGTEFDTDDFLDRRAQISVSHREWQGQTRQDIKVLGPPTDGIKF